MVKLRRKVINRRVDFQPSEEVRLQDTEPEYDTALDIQQTVEQIQRHIDGGDGLSLDDLCG